MGWHVHHKDGLFRIWSTVVDKYITDWMGINGIYEIYIQRSKKRAEEIADVNIKRALKYGCSGMPPFICEEI